MNNVIVTDFYMLEAARTAIRKQPDSDRLDWLDAAALAERQLPNRLGSGELRLIGPDRYVYYPTPEETGGGDKAVVLSSGALDTHAVVSNGIFWDSGMEILIRTKDVQAAEDAADVVVLTDCCDDVDALLEVGFDLADKVRTKPDCEIFQLALSWYGNDDNDVLTFWVGRRAQVWARLEALPDRAPKAARKRERAGEKTAYALIKQLRNGPDLPVRFQIGESDGYEAADDVCLTWEHEPDVVVVGTTAREDAGGQGAMMTSHELARRLQAGPNRLVQLRISANGGHHYGTAGVVDLDWEYEPNVRPPVPISVTLSADAAEEDAAVLESSQELSRVLEADVPLIVVQTRT